MTTETAKNGEAESLEAQAEAPVASRILPSEEEIAAWAAGEEVATIGTLFEDLKLARFDAFSAQMRNKEILPEHWQVISSAEVPPDEVFDGLPEIGRLRLRYKDHELARRRLGSMKIAWRELRGKRPSLWTVADLMVALRRILAKGIDVDFNELLSGTRDLWNGMTLPMGKEQGEILWASIALIRKGTKG